MELIADEEDTNENGTKKAASCAVLGEKKSVNIFLLVFVHLSKGVHG
jgi:hypothetical protein